MGLDTKRLQQVIEDIYAEGWYTQAEELQKLLDAHNEHIPIKAALLAAADLRESDLDEIDEFVTEWRGLANRT